MNTLRMSFLAVALLLSPAAPAAASGWSVVSKQSLDHRQHLAGFARRDSGMTVGYAGETHVTGDGLAWRAADNPDGACRYGLELTEGAAYSCGNFGHVRVSRDGGAHWQGVADFGPGTPDHCRFLSFVDARRGWAATPEELAATDDGGENWRALTLPAGAGTIAAIALSKPRQGWLLDAAGRLFLTEDGGETWTLRLEKVPGAERWLHGLRVPTVALRFTDAGHGLLVAGRKGDRPAALATADGGRSWTAETLPVDNGGLFLSRDARLLTVVDFDGKDVTLLEREGGE